MPESLDAELQQFLSNLVSSNESFICLAVAYLHLRNKFFLAVLTNRDWIAEDVINRDFQGVSSTCSGRSELHRQSIVYWLEISSGDCRTQNRACAGYYMSGQKSCYGP
jgi:hypothetical protein